MEQRKGERRRIGKRGGREETKEAKKGGEERKGRKRTLAHVSDVLLRVLVRLSVRVALQDVNLS